ncbi:uncharacterized protein LOC103316974 [Nasonia vitripennis]|uniref:RNA-directed DNA polymerase n=1 Tax=Nasonia vitripennis TaxID=7425 RepID=A0A7M7Q491_NASVI|nr:uncharacterized protein LOC103316974 [Nasonia vitripennis]
MGKSAAYTCCGPPAPTPRFTQSALTLSAANASAIDTYGTHSLTLDLALAKPLSWKFIVADVSDPILGADFLAHFGLAVDLHHRQLLDADHSHHTTGAILPARVFSVAVNITADVAEGVFADLLRDYQDLATPGSTTISLPDLSALHHIVTNGPLVAAHPRRLHGERLEAARAGFRALLKMGIVRLSDSSWASPLQLVKKADGSYRITGDYRQLNSLTVPDRYPLPVIEDLLLELQGDTFSVIDLKKAFYQVPIAPEDAHKTAITTPFGLFEFTRSSMGLRNAAQSLQRAMDHLLLDLPFARAYLDDIVVASRGREQHLEHLRVLFATLRKARIKINQDKCVLAKDSVTYLGYYISKDGFNYYSRCIPGAARLLAPLNDLLKLLPQCKKPSPLAWTKEAQDAFEKTKRALADAVTTTFLRREAPLRLYTDASDVAIGAALEQYEREDIWRPLGFFSRKLSDTERRYSTYDREFLAAFASVKHFSSILDGRPFTLYTDHKPLSLAAQQPPEKASPRQSRQLNFMYQFPIKLAYVKGPNNIVADALSRVNTIKMPACLNLTTLAQQQASDQDLPHLLDTGDGKLQPLNIEGSSLYCAVDGNVIRPYIPKELRKTVLEALHGFSHPGVRSTTRTIAQKYFWPHMRKEIARWARACETCQHSKVHWHNRAALGDFAARMRVSTTCTWTSSSSRRARVSSTVSPSSTGSPGGRTPSLFRTSRQTRSREPSSSTGSARSRRRSPSPRTRVHTTHYHPQANGLVERMHRTLKAVLMCCASIPWPQALPAVLLGLRTTFKEDLQASPAEMLFGTTLRVPGDFFVSASHPDANAPAFVAQLRGLIGRLRAAPGSRHLPPRTPFFHGDLRTCTHVFRRVDTVRTTVQPPYTGPHRVLRRLDDQRYVVEVNGEAKTLSNSSLKPAYLEVADQPPTNAPLPARASPASAAPAPPPAAPSAQAAPPAAPSAQASTPSGPEARPLAQGPPAGPSTQAHPEPMPSTQPQPPVSPPVPAPSTSPPPPPSASPSLNGPRKTVSFRTQYTSDTGGGVAVAPRAGQRRRQRKQTLQPRPDFD